MLGLFAALAAAAAAAPSVPGPYMAFGPSPASACSEAAMARSEAADSRSACDVALSGSLSPRERVATLVNRGALALVVGNTTAAETDFDAAIAMAPAEPEAWLNKALSLQSRGETAAALASFDRALALHTSHPELALLGRGLAHEAGGDIPAAFADLSRARSLAPSWQPARAELARYQVRR
jgi:tetratricopeptide (TPR) repeat protein